MTNTDIKALLKRVVELVMPDLRSYYRVVRKAKVVKTYASDGNYYADVQPLRNDDSVDPNEPVIPKVEIPVIWAGPNRGVVCPPTVGSHCDLEYYDGDPNYPRISNFRWQGNKAPAIGKGGFIIQLDQNNYIKIDPEKHIISVIEGNQENMVGGDKKNTVTGSKENNITGDKTDTIGGNWTIQVAGSVTIQAPQINLVGNVSSQAADGGSTTVTEKSDRQHEGSYELTGPMTINGDIQVNGNINATGDVIAGGSNSNHHGHS